MEVAAKIAKDEISRNRKIRQEDIGVFFITPCAAKVTSIKAPLDKEKSFVDGAISISEIYLKILSALGKLINLKSFQEPGLSEYAGQIPEEKASPLERTNSCG